MLQEEHFVFYSLHTSLEQEFTDLFIFFIFSGIVLCLKKMQPPHPFQSDHCVGTWQKAPAKKAHKVIWQKT